MFFESKGIYLIQSLCLSYEGPGDECNWDSELRGLIPRTLKYLYRRLDCLKAEFGEKVHFTVNCTLLEIYNEQVSDRKRGMKTEIDNRG